MLTLQGKKHVLRKAGRVVPLGRRFGNSAAEGLGRVRGSAGGRNGRLEGWAKLVFPTGSTGASRSGWENRWFGASAQAPGVLAWCSSLLLLS